jgi:hypothetical protein
MKYLSRFDLAAPSFAFIDGLALVRKFVVINVIATAQGETGKGNELSVSAVEYLSDH